MRLITLPFAGIFLLEAFSCSLCDMLGKVPWDSSSVLEIPTCIDRSKELLADIFVLSVVPSVCLRAFADVPPEQLMLDWSDDRPYCSR